MKFPAAAIRADETIQRAANGWEQTSHLGPATGANLRGALRQNHAGRLPRATPAQCGGKNRSRSVSRTARPGARAIIHIQPDPRARQQQHKQGAIPVGTMPLTTFGPDPRKEGVRRLDARFGDQLERLLDQNPARVQPDRKPEGSRAQARPRQE